MDLTGQNDYPADSAYSPQVIDNDQQEDTTAVQNGHPQQATATPPLDHDSNQRYNSPSLYPQPNSRPGSGMGGHPQTQYPENRQPQPASKSSVVIKVGMVGDAQIGKTSLMVKYVEGSWDEDYIQTLGTPLACHHFARKKPHLTMGTYRRQLHGEDHLNTQHRDHLLHLGSGRPARVRQHAAASL